MTSDLCLDSFYLRAIPDPSTRRHRESGGGGGRAPRHSLQAAPSPVLQHAVLKFVHAIPELEAFCGPARTMRGGHRAAARAHGGSHVRTRACRPPSSPTASRGFGRRRHQILNSVVVDDGVSCDVMCGGGGASRCPLRLHAVRGRNSYRKSLTFRRNRRGPAARVYRVDADPSRGE